MITFIVIVNYKILVTVNLTIIFYIISMNKMKIRTTES